ncbi:hypothetical protein ACEWY4_012624 [Coilia grayii]|uniref:DDE Tnp4 domain-containing protein n=1 Tax=Coilia grayii TaxID=363190 RepID=A0ABD1K114_9TELE
MGVAEQKSPRQKEKKQRENTNRVGGGETDLRPIRRLGLVIGDRLGPHGREGRNRSRTGRSPGCATSASWATPAEGRLLGMEAMEFRKGYHSINVQIVCDANYSIFNLVARWPGSTHDARILTESQLSNIFEAGGINGILLGDSGYPLKRWLMTPIVAPRTQQEQRYNTIHATTRSTVERCIGVLKRR